MPETTYLHLHASKNICEVMRRQSLYTFLALRVVPTVVEIFCDLLMSKFLNGVAEVHIYTEEI
jgi:hypothetical protein